MNITGYNIDWRELALRTTGRDGLRIQKGVQTEFRSLQPVYHHQQNYLYPLNPFRRLGAGRDCPVFPAAAPQKEYIRLIKNARSQVIIETPYFLPGFLLRKALMDASKRGVDVQIILPKHSDVRMIDILRNRYLGMLYKNNVNLLFYIPHNLHAKLLMIDNRIFSISSANFDYRSFRYQYEIALIGTDVNVLLQLKDHVSETIRNSEDFNYEQWLKRPLIEKIFEATLVPFRHLL